MVHFMHCYSAAMYKYWDFYSQYVSHKSLQYSLHLLNCYLLFKRNQYRGHIFFKPLISDKVTKLKNTKNEKYTSDARLIVIKSKKKYIIKTSFHILWNQIMNIYLLSGGFGPMSRDCRKKYKYIFLVLFKLILVIYAAASAIVVLILKRVRQSLQCNRCPLSDTVRVNIRSATFQQTRNFVLSFSQKTLAKAGAYFFVLAFDG